MSRISADESQTDVTKNYIEDTGRPSLYSSEKKIVENVLILQGGGSLGAFGCGVFKALAQKNLKIDIVAGTSIGGVNAAVIAGSKNEDHPEKLLEEFWLELTDNYIDLDKVSPSSYSHMEQLIANYYLHSRTNEPGINELILKAEQYRNKSFRSFLSSAIFGNEKMFKPRWRPEYVFTDPDYFEPAKWTYLYDHSPLAKTLEKYIDYSKLKPGGNPNSRLIMTAVNVMTSEPLIFDSATEQITAKHILATCGYPMYNFPWVEVKEGVFAWDGGLLSNTPLREVIEASPVNDKRIFLVENYPKRIGTLPDSIPEVYHRTRDIIFCDKSVSTVKISKVITGYLRYIDELYQMVENNIDKIKVDKSRLEQIRNKYKKYKLQTGAEIKRIYYISRDELFHSIYENADFSPETILDLIKEGERKTNRVVNNLNVNAEKLVPSSSQTSTA